MAYVATQLAEQPETLDAERTTAAAPAAPPSALPPSRQDGDTAAGGTVATLAWVATEVQLEPSAGPSGKPLDAVQPAAHPAPQRDAMTPGETAAAAVPAPAAPHIAAAQEASQAPLALTAGRPTDAQLALPDALGVAGSASLQQQPPAAAPAVHPRKQQAVVDAQAATLEATHTASQPANAGGAPGVLPSQHAPVASTPAMAAAAACPEPAAPDATSAEQGHTSKPAGVMALSPSPTGVGHGEASQTQLLRHGHDSQAVRGLLTQHAPGAAPIAAAAVHVAPPAASPPPATPHVPANAAVSQLAADMHRANEQAGLSYVDTCTTVAAVAEQQAISPKVSCCMMCAPLACHSLSAFKASLSTATSVELLPTVRYILQAVAQLEGVVCGARRNGDLDQLAYEGGAPAETLSGLGADSKVDSETRGLSHATATSHDGL